MSKFALRKIDLELKNENFSFHILNIDGKYLYEEFYEKYKKDPNYKSQFNQIETRIITIAEGKQSELPKTKFKILKRDKSDKFVDYEIKTKDLRLYFFKDEYDRIIVIGGKKKTQAKDLSKFRAIKKEYFANKK